MYATKKYCIRILIFYWMNLVFEEEIRHTEYFGIRWVLVGFG